MTTTRPRLLLVAAALIWGGVINGAGETAKSSLTGAAKAGGLC